MIGIANLSLAQCALIKSIAFKQLDVDWALIETRSQPYTR